MRKILVATVLIALAGPAFAEKIATSETKNDPGKGYDTFSGYFENKKGDAHGTWTEFFKQGSNQDAKFAAEVAPAPFMDGSFAAMMLVGAAGAFMLHKRRQSV